MNITRREFAGMALAMKASNLDSAISEGIKRYKIPAVAAAVSTADRIVYSAAFGAAKPDSIFGIASMTKAITTTAALQLVEQGKVTLDEPVGKHLPALAKLDVLEGFDAAGQPRLRPARKPVTLRSLLTHTSGFAYDTWDENLLRFAKAVQPPPAVPPLMTEPGTRWEYGTSIDWTGRLVEAVSGETLEAYFQKHILQPLGMTDTSYILPPEKFERKVNGWQRQPDGSLKEDPRVPPVPPKSFNGGGGLFSTPSDYTRYMRMILHHGVTADKHRILQAKSVAMMMANQTGDLAAGRMKAFRTDRSADVDFHAGVDDRFTFGFLLNTKAYDGGRSAGSLAWAGLLNTFYWIDPKRSLCAVIMMQFLPFCDPAAMSMLRDFERAVYA